MAGSTDLEFVPVDKAISWPLSQERLAHPPAGTDDSASALFLTCSEAPIQRKAVDQAPVLLASGWLKNEQLPRG